jgi:RpiR family transcriptional regulator, carbohydrate utilization regulator
MTKSDVIDGIQKYYNTFSPTECKVADYVLRYPNQVIEYTVKELANNSGVSEATIVRMCRHAGYDGYWHFRTMLAREMGAIGEGEKANDGQLNVVNNIFTRYADIMLNIGNKIDINVMRSCVELINDCNEVHVIAAGDTGTLAQHMGFLLGRVGIKATQSGIADYYINTINLASKEDVLIAISKSGITKNVIKGVELAKEKGLKIIAITCYVNSRLAEAADYVLLAQGDSTRFDYYKDYNHLNVLAVIEALLDLLKNWDKIAEKQADRLELLLSEAKL